MSAFDVAGLVGTALIVGSYFGVQIGRLAADRLAYPALNAVGAALVIVSLLVDFNLPALVLEGFWVLISLVGIGRALRRRRDPVAIGVETE